MSVAQANCPSCGALINFKAGSSVVVICANCKSAIARTDRKLEDLGKVAAIVDTNSPLKTGLTGKFKNVTFQLTGRAQLKHRLGGMWDEWYAAFSDGRWGWLAEAQGKFYLTFEVPILGSPPPYEVLELGGVVPKLPGQLVVVEMGDAQYGGAEGEIPYRLVPGAAYNYADLSGTRGEFGTLDYGDGAPVLYLGNEVTLADLGIHESAPDGLPIGRKVGVTKLACPHCGGALELHAPDQAERVVCPYCGSMLDANNGVLKYLQVLKVTKYNPLIGLGSVAEFENAKFTLIGFVVRSCTLDGIKYFWREYLLYNEMLGFRWLVHSDNHWTYVKSISPGAVNEFTGSKAPAYYKGQKFSRFQDATAVVEYVLGEFYWKVSIGDKVVSADFIHPPLMLSKEIERGEPAAPPLADGNLKQQLMKQFKSASTSRPGEINWSLGEYVEPDVIKQKFKLASIPRPTTVGACQPFKHEGILAPWGLFTAIAFAIGIYSFIASPARDVFNQKLHFDALQKSDATQTFFSDQFDLAARQNLSITAAAPVDNTWVYLEGDLINDATGEIQQFDIPVEYYHGVEDGESWTEGSQSHEIVLGALPPGKYTLRLEAQWEPFNKPMDVQVQVVQGVGSVFNFVLAIFLISILPIIILVWKFLFYRWRWAESMYNPFEGSD